MKLFVSQPMSNKSDEEIIKVREHALETVKAIKGDDVELLDSFFQGAPHDEKPLWFLSKSLELLSTADYAVFMDGWEEARGCKIEHDCAVEYGIPIIFEINAD